MQRIILLFLALFVFTFSQGQSSAKQQNDFLAGIYDIYNNAKAPFFYTKGVDKFEQEQIIKGLQRVDTLKHWRLVNGNVHIIDSLILSDDEKKLIIDKFKTMTDTSLWNDIMLPNSSIIQKDTITAIFNDKQRGWHYFHSKYGRAIHSFSIPVFFRNGELCAFYYDNVCDSLCGEGNFSIYRKDRGIWVLWFNIHHWVS